MDKDTLRKISDKIAKAGGHGLFLASGLDSKSVSEIARSSNAKVFGVYVDNGVLKAEAGGLRSIDDEEKLLVLLPSGTQQQALNDKVRRDDFELDPINSLNLILSQDEALTRDYAVIIDLDVFNCIDSKAKIDCRVRKSNDSLQTVMNIKAEKRSKEFHISLDNDELRGATKPIQDDGRVLHAVPSSHQKMTSHRIRYYREDGLLKLDNCYSLPIKNKEGAWHICEALFDENGKPKTDDSGLEDSSFRAYEKDFTSLYDYSFGGIENEDKKTLYNGARKLNNYTYLMLGRKLVEVSGATGGDTVFEVHFGDGLNLT